MARKKGLGRGLAALIPNAEPEVSDKRKAADSNDDAAKDANKDKNKATAASEIKKPDAKPEEAKNVMNANEAKKVKEAVEKAIPETSEIVEDKADDKSKKSEAAARSEAEKATADAPSKESKSQSSVSHETSTKVEETSETDQSERLESISSKKSNDASDKPVTDPKVSHNDKEALAKESNVSHETIKKPEPESKATSKASKKPNAEENVSHETITENEDSIIRMLSIDQVETNPDQPRKFFEEDALADLASSVKQYGILQPIVVKKHTVPGRAPYVIIAGERRFRAASMAGLTEVPVVIRDSDEKDSAMLSVVENIQREDLSPLEEATAYRVLMRDRMLTQQELANALGKSRAYIANMVRLLNLDPDSLEALRKGQLTSSQGRSLLAEPDLAKRAKLRKLLIEGLTNVNEVEKKTRKSNPKAKEDPFVTDLEQRMGEALGTKVNIRKRRKGWDVSVECYSNEDLERLMEFFMRDRDA